MSHFTVLVAADSREDLERKLAPYQENNMGDCPREYMEFNSQQEEFEQEWEEEKVGLRRLPLTPWPQKVDVHESVLSIPNEVLYPDSEMEGSSTVMRATVHHDYRENTRWLGHDFFLCHSWDEMFRTPGSFGLGSDTHKAQGVEVEVPFKCLYSDFDEFCREWHGHDSPDEETGEYGYWENPQAKWDWYAVGGRWSGLLRLKPLESRKIDPTSLPSCNGFSEGEIQTLLALYRENRDKFIDTVRKYKGKETEILKHIQTLDRGVVEEFPSGDDVGNGMGGVFSPVNTDPSKADYALASMVDWDGMLQDQLDKKMATYHRYHKALDKARQAIAHRHEPRQGAVHEPDGTSEVIVHDGPEWTAALEAVAFKAEEQYREEGVRGDNCRAAYRTEADCVLESVANYIHDQDNPDHYLWDTFDQAAQRFYDTEQEHRDRFKGERLTYAFIDSEGKWSAKGEMGWFGMSGNERDDFDEAFWRFVRSLPDEQKVWICDLHI